MSDMADMQSLKTRKAALWVGSLGFPTVVQISPQCLFTVTQQLCFSV